MLGSDCLADVTAGDATQRTKFFCLQVSGWPIVSRDRAKVIALTEKQGAESGFAELCRIRQHGLEHGLKLARRRADDTQHFRCRSLLLQRFGQLARALLLRLKQPHVLYRDHGLICEGCYKIDLLLSKWFNVRTRQEKSANRCSLAHEGNAKRRPKLAAFLRIH